MYIPEFFCGVAMTIIAEVTAVIAAAVIIARSDKKSRKENKKSEKGTCSTADDHADHSRGDNRVGGANPSAG